MVWICYEYVDIYVLYLKQKVKGAKPMSQRAKYKWKDLPNTTLTRPLASFQQKHPHVIFEARTKANNGCANKLDSRTKGRRTGKHISYLETPLGDDPGTLWVYPTYLYAWNSH